VPPLFEVSEGKTAGFGGREEVGKVVEVGGDFGGFVFALEVGFATLILAEGVEFAEEEVTAGLQGAGGFGEDKVDVFDVFEDKVADDKVCEIIGQVPPLGEVGGGEGDVVGGDFSFSVLNHAFGEVEGVDVLTDLRKIGGILAGATTKFEDSGGGKRGKGFAGGGLVEVACEVAVGVVGYGPGVVGVLDGHGFWVSGQASWISARVNLIEDGDYRGNDFL